MARFFTLLVAAAGVMTTSALPAPMAPLYPMPNATTIYPIGPTATGGLPIPTGTGSAFPSGFPMIPIPPIPIVKERNLRNPHINFPQPN